MAEKPFWEVHELYRLAFLQGEAQAEAEKAREVEEKKKNSNTNPTGTIGQPYTPPITEDDVEEMFDQ